MHFDCKSPIFSELVLVLLLKTSHATLCSWILLALIAVAVAVLMGTVIDSYDCNPDGILLNAFRFL